MLYCLCCLPSHGIAVDPVTLGAGKNETTVPFFDKFMDALQSPSVDLPACMPPQLSADASLSGLALCQSLWPTALSQGASTQSPGAQCHTFPLPAPTSHQGCCSHRWLWSPVPKQMHQLPAQTSTPSRMEATPCSSLCRLGDLESPSFWPSFQKHTAVWLLEELLAP